MATIIADTRLTNTTTRASIANKPVQNMVVLSTHIAIEEVTRGAATIVLFLVIFCSFLPGSGLVRLPGLLGLRRSQEWALPKETPLKVPKEMLKIRGKVKEQ